MMLQTRHTAGSSVALVELSHSLGFSAFSGSVVNSNCKKSYKT